MFAWKNEWKGRAAVAADVITILLFVIAVGGTAVAYISKHKLGWFVAVAALGLLAGLLIGGHRPRGGATGPATGGAAKPEPSMPPATKTAPEPAPPIALKPVRPSPAPAPTRPSAAGSAVRSAPAFRAAFGDHEFGEKLQRLYNEGYRLEKACRSPFQRATMGTLLGGKATDETDVRAWVNRVDGALEGRAKLRAKFDHAAGPPNVFASFATTALSDPLREELGRRLEALATIIESL